MARNSAGVLPMSGETVSSCSQAPALTSPWNLFLLLLKCVYQEVPSALTSTCPHTSLHLHCCTLAQPPDSLPAFPPASYHRALFRRTTSCPASAYNPAAPPISLSMGAKSKSPPRPEFSELVSHHSSSRSFHLDRF